MQAKLGGEFGVTTQPVVLLLGKYNTFSAWPNILLRLNEDFAR